MGKKADNVAMMKHLGYKGKTISELMQDCLNEKPEEMSFQAYALSVGIPQQTVSYWARKFGLSGRKPINRVKRASYDGNENINERLKELGYGDGNESVIAAIARFIHDEITVKKRTVAECALKLNVPDETIEFYIGRAKEVPSMAAIIETGSEDLKKKNLTLSQVFSETL